MTKPDAATPPPIVNGFCLSHGTLEARVLKESKRFYKEFLGLQCVRHHPAAQQIAGNGVPWVIVCVHAANSVHPQGPENRWGIEVESSAEVDDARSAAMRLKGEYQIQQIGDIVEDDQGRSFCLQDIDGNWWEVAHRPNEYYDKLFSGGDRV